MSERIRIKLGPMELEWESDDPLSLDNVKSLLQDISTLAPASSLHVPAQPAPAAIDGNKQASAPDNQQKLFVSTIAAKLGVKSGPDLARAAAAYLQLTEGQETFSRQDLLTAMRKAPAYFNENMRKNLSSIIKGMIPSVFNQIGADKYALTSAQRTALERALAEG